MPVAALGMFSRRVHTGRIRVGGATSCGGWLAGYRKTACAASATVIQHGKRQVKKHWAHVNVVKKFVSLPETYTQGLGFA